jgi:DNA-binding NarL/FixJ family response regulator
MIKGLAPDFHGYERQTRREWDVLERITCGASNKEAGRELAISPRTVEVHRARIIESSALKTLSNLWVLCWGDSGCIAPALSNRHYQTES